MSPPNQGYKFKASLTTAATDGTGVLVAACGASRGGGVQLSGTFSATVQFEQSLDNGLTWIAKMVSPAAGGVGVSSATGTGQWKFACGGETHVRVRCSAYTSGTIVVDANFTAGLDATVVTSGGATSPAFVAEAGTLATDRSGTITLGGTAQSAIAANTSRVEWTFVNNSDTLMMVRIAGTASASAGIPANPGDVIAGKETNAVSVFCVTTGKAFTAWER